MIRPALRIRPALAALTTLAAVVALATPAVTSAQAPETYAQYSMMTVASAGRFYNSNGGVYSGRWNWRTESPDHWSVGWNKDDPQYREYFQLSTDGNWVELDGWTDNGTYYTQRVTQESYGDAACHNMTPFKNDNGRQHYVLRLVQSTSYCLDARGTITERSSGKVFRFHHRQIWGPPRTCSNRFHKNQRCIKQWELWEDDNHASAMTLRLRRDNYLAKGLGPAFVIQGYYGDTSRYEMNEHAVS